MTSQGHYLPITVRVGVAALLCLGVGISPAVRASSASQTAKGLGASQAQTAPKSGQTPLTLRFAVLEHTHGEEPQLPFTLLQRYHGQTVVASYLVCIRSDGTVMSVNPRSGIADADSIIMGTLRTWRYPAQPPSTMTCLHEVFEFSQ